MGAPRPTLGPLRCGFVLLSWQRLVSDLARAYGSRIRFRSPLISVTSARTHGFFLVRSQFQEQLVQP
jgi:hypothetical protein